MSKHIHVKYCCAVILFCFFYVIPIVRGAGMSSAASDNTASTTEAADAHEAAITLAEFMRAGPPRHHERAASVGSASGPRELFPGILPQRLHARTANFAYLRSTAQMVYFSFNKAMYTPTFNTENFLSWTRTTAHLPSRTM